MKVGFIGLGNVGGKLAGSLLRNGVDLTIHDLDDDKVAEFAALGAQVGSGPREMMAACDVLVTCLPHPTISARVVEGEGGRHTPFFTNYRPQFYFRTTDVTGTVTLAEGTEMVMPGDNVNFKVELIAPIAMEDGLRFAIREGGRTVGAGVVAKIIE